MLYYIMRTSKDYSKKGGRDMRDQRLSTEEIGEILDMYESSSEMHTGAVIRIDLSNLRLCITNFKRVTALER